MDWFTLLIVVWSVAAAIAGWHVARGQGRDPRGWALASLLLGGLPLIWLIIDRTFALPKFGEAGVRRCCDNQSWTAVADFGHAGGVDLDLGRCENCGAYLMAVFYVASTNYVAISKEQAERFLALQGKPGFKKALKAWVG